MLVGALFRGKGSPLPRPASGGGSAQAARAALDESMEELAQLADSAGADIAGRVVQSHGGIDASTFVTSGKLEEIKQLCAAEGASLVLFDDDLAPGQMRNLGRKLNSERDPTIKILDRTELILDIFARRARTREARLAVELAQLEYLLPRLTRMWVHLSRTGGGIGTRGPGETQLESDRRQIRTRIAHLKRGLQAVERERLVQRSRRGDLFRVGLVGYTNAGKSTLFNVLTGATVLADDMLFATLDPTTRRMRPPAGDTVLLSDTVGFIRKLPHHLVASFRATLAEVREADFLLHVVDASHPAAREHISSVEEVLASLDATRSPRLLVFNKVDQVSDETVLQAFAAEYPGSIFLSAMRGDGLDTLWSKIAEAEVEFRAAKREGRGRAEDEALERAVAADAAAEPPAELQVEWRVDGED